MPATLRLSYASGVGPTLATAETGIKYNREETLAGTTAPIPRPIAAGTAYSWPKVVALEVTATAATTISNRKLHISAAEAAGLEIFYRDDGAVYTRSTANADADAGTDGATPTGYTSAPTAATVYDTASTSAGSLIRIGDYISLALAVSNTYAGGAGTAIALPDVIFTYDES